MSESAEARRDAAVARIIEAGGKIIGVEALARPETPHVVEAYRVGSARPSGALKHLAEGYEAVLAEIEIPVEGLIPLEVVDDAVEHD